MSKIETYRLKPTTTVLLEFVLIAFLEIYYRLIGYHIWGAGGARAPRVHILLTIWWGNEIHCHTCIGRRTRSLCWVSRFRMAVSFVRATKDFGF